MRTLRLTACLLLAGLLPGCIAAAVVVGAAAAYGYVSYDENGAFRDFRVNVDDAWEASLGALDSMGYATPKKVSFSDVRGEIDVQDVHLTVTANSSLSSRVRIRVGTFSTDANRERAAQIIEEVGRRLGD